MIDYAQWPESRVLSEQIECDKVWQQMAHIRPEFTKDFDSTGDFHMIRQLVLENRVGFTPALGTRCMDIGANVGTWATFCALNGANVTAYEPDSDAFQTMSEVLVRTGLKMNAVNSAIWTHTGICDFYGFKHEEPLLVRHNGVIDIGDKNQVLPSAHSVPCISLDDAIGNIEWDCLKIDIEGAEFQVFLRASDAALQKIKFAYIEFHPWVEQKTYDEALQKIERLFHIRGTKSATTSRWDDAWLTRK